MIPLQTRLAYMVNVEIPPPSKGAIRRAGKALANPGEHGVPEDARDTAQVWRAAHSVPLNAVAMRGRQRLKAVGVDGEIAQRLKRMDSIESKLRDGRSVDLATMQDIAGCRIIVENVDDLKKIKTKFTKSTFLVDDPDKYDYVWVNPKGSGYRSLHYVETYSGKAAVYPVMKVETQVRTRKMHYWATAVETVDTFFDEKLKAGHGTSNWERFFQLASGVLAISEDLPIPPNCPSGEDLRGELRGVEKELNALMMMETCQTIVRKDDELPGKAFLLRQFAESGNREITLESFAKLQEGLQAYAKSEEEEGVNAVLVEVESRDMLRRAYPNYFTDTRDFIGIIREFLEGN